MNLRQAYEWLLDLEARQRPRMLPVDPDGKVRIRRHLPFEAAPKAVSPLCRCGFVTQDICDKVPCGWRLKAPDSPLAKDAPG